MAVNSRRDPFAARIAPVLKSLGSRKAIRSVTVERDTPELVADAFSLTIEESKGFLRIIESASRIDCRSDLSLWLQGEIQRFIPHQILISAWGDFLSSNLTIDVVSAIPEVHTGQHNGCGIERLLKDFFARWIANGRRPLLLDNAACEPITHFSCDRCALCAAMRGTRSVLLHGVHGKRDGIDSLYLAFDTKSIMNGHNIEHFSFLTDLLIAQIDVGFQKAAPLKSASTPSGKDDSLRPSSLSVREQEIIKWVAQGRTNVETATILGISSFTVKAHVQRIFRKLGATNRTEAVAKHRQAGLRV